MGNVGKNTARGNTVDDYDIFPGNNEAQVIFCPCGIFINSHPWANFSL